MGKKADKYKNAFEAAAREYAEHHSDVTDYCHAVLDAVERGACDGEPPSPALFRNRRYINARLKINGVPIQITFDTLMNRMELSDIDRSICPLVFEVAGEVKRPDEYGFLDLSAAHEYNDN